jgi:hypothetical protein
MSQLHFKIEKAFSITTKSISLLAVLLGIVMISFSFRAVDAIPTNEALLSESPATSENYFLQEEISGKYKMIKAVIGGDEIILRPDRIELLFKKSQTEESSYLLFENANKNSQPVGINVIEESVEPIANKAMAEVLGVSSMKVTKFKKVKYPDLYQGVDLILTIGNDGINADVVAIDKTNASKFKMTVLANTDVLDKGGDLNFKHKTNKSNMIIRSKNKNLNFNSNKVQFSESTNSPENLNFDIILN